HAEAVAVERITGGGDDPRMVGEAEIVIGAEIDHPAPHIVLAEDADASALGSVAEALALPEPVGLDDAEGGADVMQQGRGQGRRAAGEVHAPGRKGRAAWRSTTRWRSGPARRGGSAMPSPGGSSATGRGW